MVSSFNVNVFWNEKRNKIQFLEDYSFLIGDTTIITIPAGYTTDFATIPRPFWVWLPQLGKHNPAALVHDFLYDRQMGSRKHADKVFFRMMIQYKVHVVPAYIMYLGVRIGGSLWWRK